MTALSLQGRSGEGSCRLRGVAVHRAGCSRWRACSHANMITGGEGFPQTQPEEGAWVEQKTQQARNQDTWVWSVSATNTM